MWNIQSLCSKLTSNISSFISNSRLHDFGFSFRKVFFLCNCCDSHSAGRVSVSMQNHHTQTAFIINRVQHGSPKRYLRLKLSARVCNMHNNGRCWHYKAKNHNALHFFFASDYVNKREWGSIAIFNLSTRWVILFGATSSLAVMLLASSVCVNILFKITYCVDEHRLGQAINYGPCPVGRCIRSAICQVQMNSHARKQTSSTHNWICDTMWIGWTFSVFVLLNDTKKNSLRARSWK